MNTNIETKLNNMETVSGGDYAAFVKGLMKLLLPDPSVPVTPEKKDDEEDPMAPVILPRDPLFPRTPVCLPFRTFRS